MKCTKAIIPIAGYGTRRLPITKAIEKHMLPVGNRPVVDYVVEDCIRAGITEFIFVVGEEFDQIRRYYGQNQLLEEYLESKGKTEELEEVRGLNRKARFHYVIQDQYQPYGTSTPVWLCRHLVKPGEKVLVANGDAFFYRADGGSDLADMLKLVEDHDAKAAMAGFEVEWERVHHYGIISTSKKNGAEVCDNILEQPKPEDAPTNLASGATYVFSSDIFKFAEENVEENFEGEHRITDVINNYIAQGNSLHVFRAKGEYLDCGNTKDWLHTNQRILGASS